MIGPFSVAAIALMAAYLYRRLTYTRLTQYAHFPQLPPSRVLGHLGVVDQYMKKVVPPKGHADMAFAAMHKHLGRPPVMLLDMRPIFSVVLVIGDYELAEQISRPSSQFPYAPPKVPEVWDDLVYVAGTKSIVAVTGEEWKSLRRRFSPGFQPRHLATLLPSIASKISLFLENLEQHARSGEEFLLQKYATDLTFDIIGRVALDYDTDAQTDRPTVFMRNLVSLINTYAVDSLGLPWWCTPWTDLRRRLLARSIRKTLYSIIRDRHAALIQTNNCSPSSNISHSSNSILSISLQPINSLTPELLSSTADQLSTFLFAGHDTTSTLMSWSIYELYRTPRALAAVRAEVQSIFGNDAKSPRTILSRLGAGTGGGEDLLNKMRYTSAVLKETLRLWPAAGASKMIPRGTGYTISTLETGEVCIDDLLIYPVLHIIQRDPRVYGETADSFVPERWLDEEEEEEGKKVHIPVGAWRPFERGPRNCIGQELALMEVKALIAVVVGGFEFEKVGLGETVKDEDGRAELDEVGQFVVGERMYQTREITSKPVDGMRMRVQFARG